MAEAKKQEVKYPSEVIDLPSGGKMYEKDSPLSSGKLELKYMTAKEEDILTSQNLIKKGVVIDKLLDALIVTPGVSTDELLIGDKNAVMVAARILAYGPEYKCQVINPNSMDKEEYTFNLADCPFRELPDDVDYTENSFDYQLPISKKNIKVKILTGKEEKSILAETQKMKKIGRSSEITTRLKRVLLSVEGDDSQGEINKFVDSMLSRDSLALRDYLTKITPDIILKQDADLDDETVEVDIPMTVEFFWPKSEA
tara:strand:+ start:246 stop:1010 length:765 start_codon:yes stop_codon:yes gene_type:complete